jgi:hypothetical protein
VGVFVGGSVADGVEVVVAVSVGGIGVELGSGSASLVPVRVTVGGGGVFVSQAISMLLANSIQKMIPRIFFVIQASIN